MKRLSIYCILLLAVLASCSRDTIDLPGEKTAPMMISFGSESNVSIVSRSTLGDYPENRIYNIYIAVFNSSGEKVYTHFFNDSNLKTDYAAVESSSAPCWCVSNTSDASTITTKGSIKIPVNTSTDTYKIYGFQPGCRHGKCQQRPFGSRDCQRGRSLEFRCHAESECYFAKRVFSHERGGLRRDNR